ncbi:helix-turn-helix domain-containing protein [Streptomyces sp. NPDC059743]|uniref:helix-turn-helix domain-containing protein n=1 Tax=Streptomyces sp. NPDC059743 TaxID=3346928 RepID=UPI00364CAC52
MSTVAKPTDRVLYTVEATAELLSCGRSTVYGLMTADALSFVKLGHSRRIRRADIDAFVAQLQPQSI